MLDNLWDFGVNITIFYYIINQKRNDFMGHPSTPWNNRPLIQNVCINIVNIMWEWGLVSWGGTMLQRQESKNVAIWLWLCYINNPDSFFTIFCMKTDKFHSFFVTVIFIYKEMSISISFSWFSVFSHISKSPAIIVYPCITLTLFSRISILPLDLLLLGYINNCKYM